MDKLGDRLHTRPLRPTVFAVISPFKLPDGLAADVWVRGDGRNTVVFKPSSIPADGVNSSSAFADAGVPDGLQPVMGPGDTVATSSRRTRASTASFSPARTTRVSSSSRSRPLAPADDRRDGWQDPAIVTRKADLEEPRGICGRLRFGGRSARQLAVYVEAPVHHDLIGSCGEDREISIGNPIPARTGWGVIDAKAVGRHQQASPRPARRHRLHRGDA